MKSDPLEQAAEPITERQSAINDAERRMRSVDLRYMPVYPGGQKQFNEDCQVLAMAWMDRQTLADAKAAEMDAAPVTEEWLRGIGFESQQNGLWYEVPLPNDSQSQLVIHVGTEPDGSADFWANISSETDDIELGDMKTRGDVLQLLAALGIEPKGVTK